MGHIQLFLDSAERLCSLVCREELDLGLFYSFYDVLSVSRRVGCGLQFRMQNVGLFVSFCFVLLY